MTDRPPESALVALDLRAENTHHLLGTHVSHPRLSWRMEADGRQIKQTHYRILAASSREDLLKQRNLLWDSGIVNSDASCDIPYGGPPLQSMQRVWWTVFITDNRGLEAKAEPDWFEAGLVAADNWHGQWLEAEDDLAAADRAAGLQWIWSETPLDSRLHAFRLDFETPEEFERAEIFIAAKDRLEAVWVNGVPATLPQKPYWGTMQRIGAHLRPGTNSLCIAAYADTEGFFPVDGGAIATLIRLHRTDGAIERSVSGPSFRVQTDPPEGWFLENYDASGWSHAVASGSAAQGDPRPPEPTMLVRRDFVAKAPLRSARLYATALGAYAAQINGSPVSNAVLAPEISVPERHILYQTYDVTSLIHEGSNAIGITVADGFYAGAFGWRMERYGFGPAPRRVLAQLHLEYEDGSSEWVSSDDTWQIAPSPVLLADIYGGETYDARLEQFGWDLPGYDASEWKPVEIGSKPSVELIAQTSPLLRPMQELRALSVTQPVPGRFVFDFGQNFSGVARLRVTGPEGSTITLRFAELLNADGTADQSNLRLADVTDRYILKGDPAGEVFEPKFTYHGFRYVEIEGFPGQPTLDDVTGIVIHSDCAETGKLQFSNPLLQKIWQNALWSQRSNFFAVPTDCPQRDERMGWMGDIQVFLDAAAFNMDIDPFIRRFLLEARAAQRDDGGYPIVVPQPQSFPDVVTAGWSEAGIILPYGLWQRYGDTAVIDENWQSMKRWMDFVLAANPDHIWHHDRGLDLGDWLSVDAVKPDDETTPRVLCATAYWAYVARMMAEMAQATHREGDAARYRSLHQNIRAAFIRELVADDGTVGNGSQCSQVLALHMDLIPQNLRAAAADILAADIGRRGMKLSTGFLGTPYLLDVLAESGHMEEVAGLLLQTEYPSWGYMPRAGATTMWERWNGDVGDLSMNSYNHYAFGALVGFFYRRLAAIDAFQPAFRDIAVRPLFLPEIGSVSGAYLSQSGLIETFVDGDEQGLSHLDLTVPANCTACIELPAQANWRESGRLLNEQPYISDIKVDETTLMCRVGSGKYLFTRDSKPA